jgi:hypothetical protein
VVLGAVPVQWDATENNLFAATSAAFVSAPAYTGAAPRCSYRSHLVLQRKRADCGIASPVIAGLCGQNANRQSKHERGGGDDYASGHHGSPLK